MSIGFLAAGVLAFLALLAIAQRWSILAAGVALVLIAAMFGCVAVL
jgi:hypothetical protein